MSDVTTPHSPVASTPAPRRRRWLKRLLWTALILLLCLLLGLLLLPTLLSTSPGKNFLVSQVNSRIPGKVAIDKLDLAWFSGQEIHNLTLQDPDGHTVLTAQNLKAPGVTLWSLVRGHLDLGAIELTHPVAAMIQSPDGSLNLSRALVSSPPHAAPSSAKTSLPKNLKVQFLIKDGQVTYTAPQMDPIALSSLSLTANLLDLSHIQLDTAAQLTQSGKTGALQAKLLADNIVDAAGTLQPLAATYDLNATLHALPLVAVDRLLHLNGGLAEGLGAVADTSLQFKGHLEQFTTALQLESPHLTIQANLARTGPIDLNRLAATLLRAAQSRVDARIDVKDLPLTAADRTLAALRQNAPSNLSLAELAGPALNAQLTASGTLDRLQAKLSARGQNLNANLGFDYAAQRLQLIPNSLAQLRITPTLFNRLTNTSPAAAKTLLAQAFDVRLDLARLELPWNDRGLDLSHAAAVATLSVTPIQLTASDLGQLQLRDTVVRINSDSLGNAVAINAHAVAEQSGQPGTFDLAGTVSRLLTPEGQWASSGQAADLSGTIANLPLPVLDRIGHLDGLLTNALGPRLNATLRATLTPAAAGATTGAFALTANAQNLVVNVPSLTLEDTPAGFVITQTAQASLTMQPALAAYFLNTPANGAAPAAQRRLAEPVQAQLAIGPIRIPRVNGQLDLPAGLLTLRAAMNNLVLVDPAIGTLALRNTTLAVSAPRLGDKATLTLDSATQYGADAGAIHLAADVASLFDARGQLALPQATATLNGQIDNFPVALADAFMSRPLAQTVVGRSISTPVNAKVTHLGDAAARTVDFTLAKVQAPLMAAAFSGTYTPTRLTLNRDAVVVLAIDPQTLASLKAQIPSLQNQSLTLQRRATLTVKLSRFEMPMGAAAGGLRNARLGLDGAIDQLLLANLAAGSGAQLTNVRFAVPETTLSQPLTARLDADISDGRTPGTLHAQATVNDAMSPMAGLQADVNVKALPVALLDALGGQNGKLVALLGGQLGSVTLHAAADNTQVMQFAATVDSERLKANVAGRYQSQGAATRLAFDKSSAQLLLTPAAYAAWTASDAANAAPARTTLESPMTLQLAMNQAQLAWKAPASPASSAVLDPQQVKLSITLASAGGTFRNASTGQSLRLQDFFAGVDTQNLSQLLTLALRSNYGDPAGKINSKVDVRGLAYANGQWNYDNATYDPDVVIENFPVALADDILQRHGQLIGLLGHLASATVKGRYQPTGQSNLDVAVTSDNAKLTVPGQIDNGVLRLRADATGSLSVTTDFAKSTLQQLTGWVNPTSAKTPMTFTIRHDTFAAPLKNFDLRQVRADAQVNPGTLQLQANDPVVGAALTGLDVLTAAADRSSAQGAEQWLSLAGSAIQLAQTKGKSAPPENVDFSTMNVSLNQGSVKYDSLSMTLRELTFAFQGDVNLNTKANNLTMSILGETIAKRFPGMAGSFGAGKDIVIPIGGTYDKPAPRIDSLAVQVAKFIPAAGGSNGKPGVGEILQGIQGVIGGQQNNAAGQPATPATPATPTTPAPAAPPAAQPRPRPEQQLLEGVLQGLERRRQPATQPAR